MGSQQTFYTISLPQVSGQAPNSPHAVLPESPKRMREHVERFARYFLREMHTGGIQFEATESPHSPCYVPYKAYLFNDRYHFFGAGCFRWRELQDAPASWSLDWLWLHPYFRSQGHLTRAWSVFEASHENFRLARPLSPGMQAFLRKIGRNES